MTDPPTDPEDRAVVQAGADRSQDALADPERDQAQLPGEDDEAGVRLLVGRAAAAGTAAADMVTRSSRTTPRRSRSSCRRSRSARSARRDSFRLFLRSSAAAAAAAAGGCGRGSRSRSGRRMSSWGCEGKSGFRSRLVVVGAGRMLILEKPRGERGEVETETAELDRLGWVHDEERTQRRQPWQGRRDFL